MNGEILHNDKTMHRIEYLDLFRGFGILLMIICHIGCGRTMAHIISAFHMPMWFIISGYLTAYKNLFEKYPFGSYLKAKAKALLVPYLLLGIICFFSYCLIKPSFGNVEVIKNFFWMNSECKEVLGAYWFLTAMFFANIFYYFLSRFISSSLWRTVLIIIVALLGNILPEFFSIRLPFSIDNSLVGIGLMDVGNKIGRNENSRFVKSLMNLNWKHGLCLLLVFIMLILLNGTVQMRPARYSFIPLFWINAIGMTILGMNAAKGIVSCCSDKSKVAIINYIESVGEHSVIYLCLNLLVILALYKLTSGLGFPIVAVRFFIFIGTICILYVLSELINRTKLKVIIGEF